MPSQSEKRKKRRIDEYFGEDDPNSGLQETQEEYLFRTFKEDEEFINSQINLLKQKFEVTDAETTLPQSVVRSVTKKLNKMLKKETSSKFGNTPKRDVLQKLTYIRCKQFNDSSNEENQNKEEEDYPLEQLILSEPATSFDVNRFPEEWSKHSHISEEKRRKYATLRARVKTLHEAVRSASQNNSKYQKLLKLVEKIDMNELSSSLVLKESPLLQELQKCEKLVSALHSKLRGNPNFISNAKKRKRTIESTQKEEVTPDSIIRSFFSDVHKN